MAITSAQVKSIAGAGARSDLVSAIVRGWSVAALKAKLTSRNRAAHFLAQIMTETGGLQILEESGAYRAPRIMEIFGVGHHSAAVTESEARRIAALPVAQRGPVLFNRVYGTGNPRKMREFNNTGPNDGWLYRGGGMMQATGKSNYAAMAKKTGLPLVEHPEMLHMPDSAFTAAYLEWAQDGRCNAAADRDDVVAVRKIINGGTNGINECRAFLAKAKKVLADYAAPPPPASLEPEPEPEPQAGAYPQAPSGPDGALIVETKKKLDELGYHEFGILNADWGGRTVAAIAAYKLDRGMTGPAEIDDALTAQLNQDIANKWQRPMKDERANATVKDLAPNETIKQNWWTRLWAKIVAIPAGIGAAISGIMDKFPDAKANYIDPIMQFFSDVPGWLWFVAAAGAAAAIWVGTRKSDTTVVKQFQTGKLLQ